jgi:diguanylate cyclase (GGDEF)-like protein
MASHGRAALAVPERGGDEAAVAGDRGEARFMRRLGVGMFAVGCLTLLGTLPLPDPNTSDHPGIEVVAALLAIGALLVGCIRGERRWIDHAWVLYGLLLISALMGITRPIEATPFFYLWPMVFSAYFLSRRAFVFDLLVMWVSMGIALFGFSIDPMKGIMFMGVGVSVSLTAFVVMLLRQRQKDLIEALERASNTDHLTGLPNRRAFDRELEAHVDRAHRSGTSLALALFDLDHFKEVNDRYGHPAGDRVLCEFAALLADEQRGGDAVARIGGEEFAVVLFDVDLEQGVTYAQRISARLREQTGDRELSLSTSAGVAVLGADDQPAALLLAADRALYAAKAAGRKRVAMWDAGEARIAAHGEARRLAASI